jgi:nucleotide-binding universal stress UspA family protein
MRALPAPGNFLYMYRNIVVGYDRSDQAEDALVLGKLLADASGASLTVGGVFLTHTLLGKWDGASQEAEEAYTRELGQAADSVGAEVLTIRSSSPARGLRDLAAETGAELVVVGSPRHSNTGHALAGTLGTKLLHGSPSSLSVAPLGYAGRAPAALTEIVVGYDGSQEAQIALRDATALARTSGALLKIVAVAEPPLNEYEGGDGPGPGWYELRRELERDMGERLTGAVDTLPADVRVESFLVRGQPAAVLVDIARDDGALLMLGSRSYGTLRRVLLGTVATALVRTAHCPMVVHPRPAALAGTPAKPVPAGSG